MAKKVEEQKGPIKAQEDTYRTMTQKERVSERAEEIKMRRDYQSLHKFEPKK